MCARSHTVSITYHFKVSQKISFEIWPNNASALASVETGNATTFPLSIATDGRNRYASPVDFNGNHHHLGGIFVTYL